MRDKVDYMQEEVNVVSRHRAKFGTELLIPTTSEPNLKEENSFPISKQHNSPRHILRGV
jgi:hypothetical protein